MASVPKQFLWGATLSAHQVEGGEFQSDWWRWEQRPGHIADDATSLVAADHYNRVEEDLSLARKLGIRSLLVSIEWSRIQPEAERFDDAAIAHYRGVFRNLAEEGIEPVCALQHVTLPHWFAEQGGWHARDAAKWFEKYAQRAAKEFAPQCRWWIPIWEPMRLITHGYFERIWPPAEAARYAFRAIRSIAHAHAAAARALRAQRPDMQIGVGLHAQWFVPMNPDSAWDLRAARREHFRCNLLLPRVLQSGRWPWRLRRDPELKGSIDFVGAGYAGVSAVRFNPRYPHRLFCEVRDTWEATRTAPEISSPQGLAELLMVLRKFKLPILITGAGVPSTDETDRCRFILDHVAAVEHALQQGLKIEGYFHRSLLDGFEWERGYRDRYGLIHVDRRTLARTPNSSAYLYKDICEHGGIRKGAAARFCEGWATPPEIRSNAALSRV